LGSNARSHPQSSPGSCLGQRFFSIALEKFLFVVIHLFDKTLYATLQDGKRLPLADGLNAHI